MDNDEQPTCGKGLAASAALPAKLGELLAARGDVLERHMKALDLTDPSSRAERDVYESLTRAHRDLARGLTDLAREMAASRDLPMGRHDPAVMADTKGQMEAFRRFVATERELVDMVTEDVKRHQELMK